MKCDSINNDDEKGENRCKCNGNMRKTYNTKPHTKPITIFIKRK